MGSRMSADGAPREPGWWRRNAVALVLVVALAAATVWIVSAREWHDYFGYRPTQAIAADPQGIATVDDVTYRLVGVERVRPDELPHDTAALVVTIEIEPEEGSPPPEGCVVDLRERGGSAGERTWGDADSAPTRVPLRDDTTSYCPLDATEGYTLQVPFIVPIDADGTLAVLLDVGLAPRYVEFEVGPLRDVGS